MKSDELREINERVIAAVRRKNATETKDAAYFNVLVCPKDNGKVDLFAAFIGSPAGMIHALSLAAEKDPVLIPIFDAVSGAATDGIDLETLENETPDKPSNK
jgi:hypothetical protein